MTTTEIETIEQLLGHRFNDHELLARALTHASLVDSRLQSNERLEFLGDAVLGLVVCSDLYNSFCDQLEGEMTKIKSTVVSRKVCAEIAQGLGLDELLRLGKGMSKHASLPGSVLAAVFESLVGALYLDGGLEKAREFVLRVMRPRIEAAARSGHQQNFKSVLQQSAQQTLGQTPQYLVLDEKGPDHAKCFEVAVEIGARRFSSCWGPSKKQAEQDAALLALKELGIAVQADDGEVLIQRPPQARTTADETRQAVP
jgi:ribonuclease-3